MLARVMERSSHDLSLPQYRILSLVARGDERATVLAGRLALTKPTVSAIVDALVERGALERHAVAGDRRSTQLVITPAGRDALAASEAAMAAEVGRLLDQLEHRDVVLDALAELDGIVRSEWHERVAARLTQEPER